MAAIGNDCEKTEAEQVGSARTIAASEDLLGRLHRLPSRIEILHHKRTWPKRDYGLRTGHGEMAGLAFHNTHPGHTPTPFTL